MLSNSAAEFNCSMTQTPSIPLPLRFADWWLGKFPYPVIAMGLAVSLPLLALFTLTDSIYPSEIPPWDANPLEMTGLFLMLAALPSFVLMCFVGSRQQNIRNHQLIVSIVDDADSFNQLVKKWYGRWPAAVVFGVLMVPFNVGTEFYDFDDPRIVVDLCIVFGQIVLWLATGIVLFFAFVEALLMHRVANEINFNFYDLDVLNGFGRNALNNLLMVAGALALTTLQAIDQELRWYNYQNGLLVGIPAVIVLVPLPIWRLHRRIMAQKQELLAGIDQKIRECSTALEGEAIEILNRLLIRREQVLKTRSWPMNLSIFSRFVMYAFIVPAAWAGAALTEVILDSVLGI